jgi:DNA-binding NarL/FixJ family response regulator
MSQVTPIERIPVYVRGLDLVSESGVSALLRPRPEVLISDNLGSHVAVAVAVADGVDDAALSLVRELHAQGVRHVLLIVTAIDDTGLLTAIGAGVCGVVPRAEATPERLVTAIRHARAKGGVLSPRLVGQLMTQVHRLQNQVLAPRGIQASGLSQRETEVLRLIALGMEVSEIADKLSYSERTIKNTLHDVLSRFQLRNRTQAVAFAIREGLI